jgi:hypothetical protein
MCFVCLYLAGGVALAETHGEIQAVDAAGDATHPKVIRPGVPWDLSKQVVLEGVVVVAPNELADTASELLIAFQGEGGDHACTQIWTGAFFQDWPEPYGAYFGLLPGDRIRVTGYAAQFIGKTNINEQHSDDPARDFVIELIGHAGMPVPEVVPSVAVAKAFDQTRATGGEYYQSRWVRMNNLTITSPETWQAGEQVTVTDGTGSMPMMLSVVGDFDSYSPPAGAFDVVALFDQEPLPLDFAASRTEHYRLWVKRTEHILPPGGPFPFVVRADFDHDGDVDMADFGHLQRCMAGPSTIQIDPDCFDARLDADGDVDADDLAVFDNCFSGPNVPASPQCAP